MIGNTLSHAHTHTHAHTHSHTHTYSFRSQRRRSLAWPLATPRYLSPQMLLASTEVSAVSKAIVVMVHSTVVPGQVMCRKHYPCLRLEVYSAQSCLPCSAMPFSATQVCSGSVNTCTMESTQRETASSGTTSYDTHRTSLTRRPDALNLRAVASTHHVALRNSCTCASCRVLVCQCVCVRVYDLLYCCRLECSNCCIMMYCYSHHAPASLLYR